jgi:hypothetical protein
LIIAGYINSPALQNALKNELQNGSYEIMLLRSILKYIQKLAKLAVFVFCDFAGGQVIAAPVLDLDEDDSRVIGYGFYNSSTYCYPACNAVGGPLEITDNDVIITGAGSGTIALAHITLLNPEADDVLTVGQLPPSLQALYVTQHDLYVSGTATPDVYQTALGSITLSNSNVTPGSNLCGLRLINIDVFDISLSNTAVATIEICEDPISIRGLIYVSVLKALNSVFLSGVTVSLSATGSTNIFEVGDLYVVDVDEGTYTVNASLAGFVPSSVGNVLALQSNDPSQPVPIYLCLPADADVVPDGQINVGDYLVATRIVLGLKTGMREELCHGDMNGDGKITLSDLIAILQAVQAAP